MLKVGIISGEYGHGHLALAKKLQSHIKKISKVDTVDIVNLTQEIDQIIKKKCNTKGFRYAMHYALHFTYQEYSTLPEWVIAIHPLTWISKYFKKTWSFFFGTSTPLV